jgi:ribosome maturation factor RimP
MHGQYRLEVSSPGIERKLTKPKHFKQSIGDKVKAKVFGGEKLKGVLKSADDEGIVIETKEGEKALKYDQLGTVKTYFEF